MALSRFSLAAVRKCFSELTKRRETKQNSKCKQYRQDISTNFIRSNKQVITQTRTILTTAFTSQQKQCASICPNGTTMLSVCLSEPLRSHWTEFCKI